MISVAVHTNIDALEKALVDYAQMRNMSAAQVLTKKGKDLMFRLFFGFMKVVPSEDDILRDTAKAGWRLRVGPIARKLAKNHMGGTADTWGNILTGPRSQFPASGLLRTLRIGKRGRPIIGGRHGRKGRGATAAEGEHWLRSGNQRALGKRRMSAREVSMFMETMLRLRGRRSLAISWLHRRRMQAIDTLRRLYIVNPLAEEKLQGRAAYDVFKRGGTLFGTQEHRWSLSSHMPGVQKWPGVISTALAAAVIDIGVYFERKQAFWLQRKIQQRLMTEPIKRIA